MSEPTPPSPTASNGRGPGGRFGPGNRLAKGNPYAAKVGKLRTAVLGAVSGADLAAIIKAMLAAAVGGDTAAAKLVLDRTLGPAVEADLVERIEALERSLAEQKEWQP